MMKRKVKCGWKIDFIENISVKMSLVCSRQGIAEERETSLGSQNTQRQGHNGKRSRDELIFKCT